MAKYDFSGWATRNDLLCSDGRTIRRNAFQDCDGKTVPLVWNHDHTDPDRVLGHALLENRDEGVYAYCSFNETPAAQRAKNLVNHGDIRSLSIFANQLRQNAGDVLHGMIREVSLVLAGANPGAFIENVMSHSEEDGDCLILGYDENIMLYHSEEAPAPENIKTVKEDNKMAEKTIQEIWDSMTEEQQNVCYAIIGAAMEDEEGDNDMKHNLFDNEYDDYYMGTELAHTGMEMIISDAKRFGSMKESYLQHAADYGIENIDYLFPDAKSLNNPPEFIKEPDEWVGKIMNAVHHTPFARIKSTFADITEDEARAKGFIKGNLKKEEVFSLLKRVTTPTTVYKKQKMDRDDQIDITDFDVISWLKTEMRGKLDEELARAFLIGDGRLSSSDDHIPADHIRPIYNDSELFTLQKKVTVAGNATTAEKAKEFIRTAIKARKDYRGSGNPTLYTTEDWLSEMLLLTDSTGRDLYEDEAQLCKKLRVKEIVTVPVMENQTGVDGGALVGIIVNMADYNVGADKGGSINMFDDFDIDYNQMKYLIETRCSGALTKPHSAIALELATANA